MKNSKKISAVFLSIFAGAAFAQQTMMNGYFYAPDERLLEGKHWVSAYVTKKFDNPKPLQHRSPSAKEMEVVEQAKKFFEASSLKAIALIDGNELVWKAYKSPANDQSIFTGYSLGKTITSMMVGQSICAGKLSMSTTADSLLPELKGTGYESVTVADLLTMRSGIKDGSYWGRGTAEAKEKIKQVAEKKAKWRDMLKVVNQRHSTVFGTMKPGEKFEYKEIDPLVLGYMLQEAWGERLGVVMEKNLLSAAGFQGPAELQEGAANDPYAPTIGRFTLDDWIRFSIWMKASTKEQTCFGDYVRSATTSKAQTVAREMGSQLFDGYGYLTWIGSRGLPDSYWAWGFGGQKMGMNHKNDRIIVVFSSVENNHDQVHSLYKAWASLD